MDTLAEARSFSDVLAQVVDRADQQLPDHIVHIADLSMDVDGNLSAQTTPTYRMNDWSQKQLSRTLLGIRWAKWFSTATPEERAEEVTRRLARTPGEIKIRGWKDYTGHADGITRAFLSPGFTPIDDVRVFDRLGTNLLCPPA